MKEDQVLKIEVCPFINQHMLQAWNNLYEDNKNRILTNEEAEMLKVLTIAITESAKVLYTKESKA